MLGLQPCAVGGMARGLRGRTAVRDAHGKVDERLSHVDHDNPPRFVTLAGFSLLSQALGIATYCTSLCLKCRSPKLCLATICKSIVIPITHRII